jgi:hypothetical protein
MPTPVFGVVANNGKFQCSYLAAAVKTRVPILTTCRSDQSPASNRLPKIPGSHAGCGNGTVYCRCVEAVGCPEVQAAAFAADGIADNLPIIRVAAQIMIIEILHSRST